jgi:hypothetical protein
MVDGEIKDFLTYDYTEAKDLGKAFLTLMSAILVFSITFSEKIVDFQKGSQQAKRKLFWSWNLIVTAIILCGTSLVFDYAAQEAALQQYTTGTEEFGFWISYVSLPSGSFGMILSIGNTLITLAGICFVLSLTFMLRSAIESVNPTAGLSADHDAD